MSGSRQLRFQSARGAVLACVVVGLVLGLACGSSSAALPPVVAVQADGKLLVAEHRHLRLGVERLKPNGRLDKTFGNAGFASTGVQLPQLPTGLIVEPSGAIDLASFGYGRESYGAHVFQFTPSGALDTAFGGDGSARPSMSGSGGLAVTPDGDIVLGGYDAPCLYEPDCPTGPTLAELRPDGSANSSFGDGGKITLSSRDVPYDSGFADVAVQPDGRILAGGSFGLQRTSVLARYAPSGGLDTSFGQGNGWELTSIPVDEVALDFDGSILAGGATCCSPGSRLIFGVARFGATGAPDSSFGSGAGSVVDQERTRGLLAQGSMTVGDDGQITLADFQATGCKDHRCRWGFELRRYEADGSRDPGFGKSGVVDTQLIDTRLPPLASQVALAQVGGRVIAVGYLPGERRGRISMRFAAIGYLPDGSLDPAFGNHGVVLLRSRSRPILGAEHAP